MTEILMPAMGESIHEATVLTWLKKPGDHVEIDEPLLEVATDKVDTEIPSTHTGILKEILIQEGQVAVIGKPICRMESTEVATPEAKPEPPTPDENSSPEEVASFLESSVHSAAASLGPRFETPATQGRYYSPLVLTICEKEGISMEELNAIPGTGADGRVTKNDILDYVANRPAQKPTPETPQPVAAPTPAPTNAPKPVSVSSGTVEIIEMDRMRKIIAERMVDSKRIAPHVSSFVETDMTTLSRWRDRMKGQFQKEYGENLTYTPLLIEAVVKAIKDFPMINSSVEGDKILVKKAVNVGMAVALPNGNLIVPVIHNADQYNLVGLTKKINDLTKRARENKLKAEDLVDGTYTVSNIGSFGNIMGTPIILQPQVAIMAFGVIQKKPAVIETPEGDVIAIRQKMFISHSYDHRIVDGSLGGQFVKRVSDYLENFDPNRKLI
ncbi:dihydrolipoamide acetyltransferase family protein [Siphonobacter sp. SORGH_AS_1065]|uniref:dihydrolipoamide acetyltransferase family protein n=1 Tax=Siphonobacter sp. SORGH_AS_1065 TaxID=3041795 RepID=UPI0027849FC5|nr:dihydrolipoamide acetyltransferase family protein [Siphonobacter sp. SORGH_AS_1065]MDQ1088950.1 2-oxoglutarate dehydrogenase E2 component (dihydrolipoamide succinyltransferase) [Siphonobacter sp. SORGH_AS_1065]